MPMNSVWKIYLAIMLVIFTFIAAITGISLFLFLKPAAPASNFSNLNANSVPDEPRQPDLKKVRENFLAQVELKSLKEGTFLRLEGENKDTLIIKSSKLPASEIETVLRSDLSNYRSAGFLKIHISDAEGTKKIIDLINP